MEKKSQSLLHQVNLSNQYGMMEMASQVPVAIPSSSGQSLQPQTTTQTKSTRSVAIPSSSGQSLQRMAHDEIGSCLRVAIPSSSGQSLQQFTPKHYILFG